MIRIAFDTTVTRPPFTHRGLFEYTRLMLEQFRMLAPEFDVQVSAYVGTDFAPEIMGLPESPAYRTVTCKLMNHLRLWRYGGGACQMKKDGNEVMFTTNADTITLAGLPLVVTIHDVVFMRSRLHSRLQTARLLSTTWMAAHSAKYILTNSECSKRDIVRFLGVHPTKVLVIYHGYRSDLYNEQPAGHLLSELRERFGLMPRYIIHIGTLQPRKNLVRLILAYDRLVSEGKARDIDLVLAGNHGWDYDEILKVSQSIKPPGRVVITGFLHEKELAALAKGARLSVIPSLCEGFCVPMVESMACGVPTVVANNSCFPEISGGVLRYFNAESIEEIAKTMYDVLQSSDEQNRLRQGGLARAADFSWERCARQTLQALRQAAAKN